MFVNFKNKVLTTSINKGVEIFMLDDAAKLAIPEGEREYLPNGEHSEEAKEDAEITRILMGK